MSAAAPRTLVVVAHPDDETLWFSSVVMRTRADVVCATCGSDEKTRVRRAAELREACAQLGAQSVRVLGLPDRYGERLDAQRLEAGLRPFAQQGYAQVFTHGLYGETHEHFHHQDVCLAVHRVFPQVWSIAWNQLPGLRHELSAEEYAVKKRVVGTVYAGEYATLKLHYEISATESFCRHSRASIEAFQAAMRAGYSTPKGGMMLFDDPSQASSGRQAAEVRAAAHELAPGIAPVSFASLEALERGLREQATQARAVVVTPARRGFAASLERLGTYRIAASRIVPARWEPLRDPGAQEPEVYKDGVLVCLLEKRD